MMRKVRTRPLGIYVFFLSRVSLLICFGFIFILSGFGFFFFFFLTKWNLFSLFLFIFYLVADWGRGVSESGIVED